MKATNTHITSRSPEPSAAYVAREAANEIVAELDRLRGAQPIAGRLAQVLLLRQIAGDLAPVLLELMACVSGERELPARRRRGDARALA
ncbi:MAG: hypothetical protein ACREFP_03890 [Acetobacteraceae bacterium]